VTPVPTGSHRHPIHPSSTMSEQLSCQLSIRRWLHGPASPCTKTRTASAGQSPPQDPPKKTSPLLPQANHAMCLNISRKRPPVNTLCHRPRMVTVSRASSVVPISPCARGPHLSHLIPCPTCPPMCGGAWPQSDVHGRNQRDERHCFNKTDGSDEVVDICQSKRIVLHLLNRLQLIALVPGRSRL